MKIVVCMFAKKRSFEVEKSVKAFRPLICLERENKCQSLGVFTQVYYLAKKKTTWFSMVFLDLCERFILAALES